MSSSSGSLRFSALLAFYLPLSATVGLMSVSHLIINGTLARSISPEIAIAGFAVALSLSAVADRPLQLLRQTCSVLLRDKRSFAAISRLARYVIASVMLFGLVLGFSPLGSIVMRYFYDLDGELLASAILAYRVILFASLFSGIRCLYQGVIIAKFRTKWMTIGMCIRLIIMSLMSLWFVSSGFGDAWVGAALFVTGMFIEAAVSFLEGRRLIAKTPEVSPNHEQFAPGSVYAFYRPLLYSSFVALFIGPSINAMLGRTMDYSLSIAAFAIGANVFFFVTSIVFYTHQLAMQFYSRDRRRTLQFILLLSLVSTSVMGLLAYSEAGVWFLQEVMGVTGRLLTESRRVLRIMMIYVFVFTWLDYSNGLAMLFGRTKILFWSQGGNFVITLIALLIGVLFTPGWNGIIGAIAQSCGVIGELCIVQAGLRWRRKADLGIASR